MRLFRSRRRSRLPLTICCVTDRSPERVLAATAGIDAEQLIVGLLPTAPGAVAEYGGDRREVVELAAATREQRRLELERIATADWILHLDADELLSPALVRALPRLLEDDATCAWRLPRRTIAVDGGSWHDESPWWPALATRLVRRGVEHSAPTGTVRTTDAPLLVLTAAERELTEREELVLQREVVELGGPGAGALRGPEVRRRLPERWSALPPAPLPADEAAVVATVLGRAAPPVSAPAATERASATTATISPLERDLRCTAESYRELLVEVHNSTDATWSSAGDDQTPRHRLGYHWRLADGTAIEGMRTDLPRPLEPGDREVLAMGVVVPDLPGPAILELSVVHELVAWLGGSCSLDVVIAPGAPLTERREVRVAGPPIPKVIHRIWLGGKPMPEAYVEYGRTWERLHPGWEMRLWTDDDAPIPACADRARSISEVSDLIRYELMRQHGGVYVDTDIECLRPIDELIAGTSAFSSYEVPGRLCPALMGSVPGHPAFERLCELVAITVGHGHYPENTATVLSTFALEPRNDITLFGPDRFYPELWDGSASSDGEPPYADHHWAMSWNT